jgi:hypothetical protein
MVLRTITGARTPACLLTAIDSVEAVTPPLRRGETGDASPGRNRYCGIVNDLPSL